MRHYATDNVSSFVIRHDPRLIANAARREILSDFQSALGTRVNHLDQLVGFVFDGDRTDAHLLFNWLTPAEFRSVVAFRVWVKKISEQCMHRSPRFWTRIGDFCYVNLNTGKCFVGVDAHYWD